MLKLTAVAVLTLMVLALVRQEMSIRGATSAIALLQGDGGSGLVPVAEAAQKRLQTHQEQREQFAAQLRWLDIERRPSRIAVEMLAAISTQENPGSCPITLTSYQVDHDPGLTVVMIDGFARAAGGHGTDVVLKEFETGLRNRYPLISQMIALPKPLGDNQPFQYRIEIKDDQDN